MNSLAREASHCLSRASSLARICRFCFFWEDRGKLSLSKDITIGTRHVHCCFAFFFVLSSCHLEKEKTKSMC
ncbi:hypothetical protein BDW62DRAFT_190098 [Aspergillus aurantiobrunneus]